LGCFSRACRNLPLILSRPKIGDDLTPKEVAQRAYDCFSTGDMATFKTLFGDSAIIKNNGMHKFSRTYQGADDFINNLLAHIPSHFINFKVETV